MGVGESRGRDGRQRGGGSQAGASPPLAKDLKPAATEKCKQAPTSARSPLPGPDKLGIALPPSRARVLGRGRKPEECTGNPRGPPTLPLPVPPLAPVDGLNRLPSGRRSPHRHHPPGTLHPPQLSTWTAPPGGSLSPPQQEPYSTLLPHSILPSFPPFSGALAQT